jgi:hypothetical protein
MMRLSGQPCGRAGAPVIARLTLSWHRAATGPLHPGRLQPASESAAGSGPSAGRHITLLVKLPARGILGCELERFSDPMTQ